MGNLDYEHKVRLSEESNIKFLNICKQIGISRSGYLRNEIEKALNQDKVIEEQNELLGRILEELRVYKDQVRENKADQIRLFGGVFLMLLEQKFGTSDKWTAQEREDIGNYVTKVRRSGELTGRRFYESDDPLTNQD